MQKNTPELWDKLWKDTTIEEDRYNIVQEENCIRWQRIESLIRKNFRSFNNLKIIEVGAGAGTNALLFSKKGAKVTILDYSKKAIERSREFFQRNNCKANFILADALKLPKKLLGKYDISMSFGLAEHFSGQERLEIIKSHLDLISKSGIAIISVPNKNNPPYRIYKFLAQLIGIWKFGEEYPFSTSEFRKIAKILNINDIFFIGDSFFSSFRFINPFRLFRKKDASKIKREKGSFLDSSLGYSLVFIANYKPTRQN